MCGLLAKIAMSIPNDFDDDYKENIIDPEIEKTLEILAEIKEQDAD